MRYVGGFVMVWCETVCLSHSVPKCRALGSLCCELWGLESWWMWKAWNWKRSRRSCWSTAPIWAKKRRRRGEKWSHTCGLCSPGACERCQERTFAAFCSKFWLIVLGATTYYNCWGQSELRNYRNYLPSGLWLCMSWMISLSDRPV